eukprot:scaffold21778_cov131-Isochrysis_galbana.AAC.9
MARTAAAGAPEAHTAAMHPSPAAAMLPSAPHPAAAPSTQAAAPWLLAPASSTSLTRPGRAPFVTAAVAIRGLPSTRAARARLALAETAGLAPVPSRRPSTVSTPPSCAARSRKKAGV